MCFASSISSQVRSSYSDGRPFLKKSFISSPKIPYFSPAPSPRYNSSILIGKKDGSMKLVSLERGMGVPILDGRYNG